MSNIQEVKYERLLEVLNSTNPNVALITLHVTTGFISGDSNEQCYNIEVSTGYKKYVCKYVPAWTDIFYDLDEAVNHLPKSCFVN